MNRLHCTAAMVATVLFVGPGTARADDNGGAILREAFKKLHAARSLTMDITYTLKNPRQPQPRTLKGTVALMKPNFLRIDMTGPGGIQIVADGKHMYNYSTGGRQYFRTELGAKPTEMSGPWEGEIDGFFGGEAHAAKGDASLAGSATVNGTDCHLVKIAYKEPTRTATFAIGKADRLIYRTEIVMADSKFVQTNTLSGHKLNAPLQTAYFKFSPPKNASLYDPSEALRELEAKLVSVGKDAPNFTLQTAKGAQVALGEASRGKKAVLVNFWFYG